MYGKSEDRADYQDTPGPLAAMARDLPDGHSISVHSHRRAQLIYGSRGAITVTTPAGTWVAPPQRAVWVPAGVEHSMRTSGSVPMRTVYIEQDARPTLPRACTVVAISSLMRELIAVAVRIPLRRTPGARDERIMQLILDELEPLHEVPLQLTLPHDETLLKVCQRIIDEPGIDWSTTEWARWTHLSERTFMRRFHAQLGCTFGQWRQQARLLAAVEWLANGRTIADVSADLSYESPSAFSAMFRRSLGKAPSQYFAE